VKDIQQFALSDRSAAVGYSSGNDGYLARGKDPTFTANREFELTLQYIGNLLVRMIVFRQCGSSFNGPVGQGHILCVDKTSPISRDYFPFRYFIQVLKVHQDSFESDLVIYP
jgi:hypothetical protein